MFTTYDHDAGEGARRMSASEHDFPPFEPHPWLLSGHVQTLAGVFLPAGRHPYRARQHRVELPDGDVLVMHDDEPTGWRNGDRTTLMLHGLAGTHRSGYMQRISARLHAAGVRTFRLDLRGWGAGFGLARHPCHAGRSEDAAAALSQIARLCPRSPTTVIGFSLGGNITLKLLGEIGSESCGHMDSAVAVCPPLDLSACCRRLEAPSNRLFDYQFVWLMLKQVSRARAAGLQLSGPPSFRRRPRSVREFDAAFTAPASGFATVDEYYRLASSLPVLPKVCWPTLVLRSADDPMIPCEADERLELPTCVELHTTRHGGHMGFISRRRIGLDHRWMDARVVHWILTTRF
jgi:uncharacterized protein